MTGFKSAKKAVSDVIDRVRKPKGASVVDQGVNPLDKLVTESNERSKEHVLKMRAKIDADHPHTPPKAIPSGIGTAGKVAAGVVGVGGVGAAYHVGKRSGQDDPQGFKDSYFTNRNRHTLQKTAFIAGALRSTERRIPIKGSSLEAFAADSVKGQGQGEIQDRQKTLQERTALQKVAKEVLKRDQAYADAHKAVTRVSPLLNEYGIDAEYERAAMFGTPAAASKAVVKNWEDVRKLTDDVSLARSRLRNEAGFGAAVGALGGAGLGIMSAAKSKNPAAWKQAVQGVLGGAAGATAGAQVGAMPGRRAESLATARLNQEKRDFDTNTRTLSILRRLPGNRYEDWT
jgi:hypothetical protein